MRIISFIDQPEVIRRILAHLGLWKESQAPPDSRKFTLLSYHYHLQLEQASGSAFGDRSDARGIGLIFDYRQRLFKRAETAAVIGTEYDSIFTESLQEKSGSRERADDIAAAAERAMRRVDQFLE